MKFFVIAISLLLCGFYSYSQSGYKVYGSVLDSATNQPIEYATVAVTNNTTNKVVNGAIADAKGAFEVAGLPTGDYRVTVEFLGYARKAIEHVTITGKNLSLGAIVLMPEGRVLKEVTISGSAPIIENKVDKLVYNAANDITSQGGTAMDILRKVPQVNVDVDGTVELQGSTSIRFLINGKPSTVFGNTIADALAAIPASQIKSIEVITSPGAKYDAQGTGGIINIILKESKMQGVNCSINLSGGNLLENGSANINVRHNNFGINAYAGSSDQLRALNPITQDRSSHDSTGATTSKLVQVSNTYFRRTSYNGGLGFDWSPTKRDNFTGGISYNHFQNETDGPTTLNQTLPTAVNSTRKSDNTFNTHSADWNLDYKRKFKKDGQELELLYTSSFSNPVTSYSTTLTPENATAPYSGSRSTSPGTTSETNISADYAQPLTEKTSLETGLKTVLQNYSGGAVADTLQPPNTFTEDPGQTYHLNYSRQIYAAYFSLSCQLFNYLKVKAGARYEHTETQIDYPNTSIAPYNTLVPSIILSHDVSKSAFVKLAYTRRIERPEYRDLNPFVNLADPYNITTGNPSLVPEVGNNTELGYNKNFGKGSNLYMALIERINTHDLKPFTTFYPVYATHNATYYNVSVTEQANTGTEYNSGATVAASHSIKDKLTFRGNVSLWHRYLMTSIGEGDVNAGFRLRANLNTSYQFPNNLISELFGNYYSANGNIQGRSPQWFTYTVAFRKQFWNKNASIGLTATNFFAQYIRQEITVNTPTYSSTTVKEFPYRSVGISFVYKFGKLEFKEKKEENNYMGEQ